METLEENIISYYLDKGVFQNLSAISTEKLQNKIDMDMGIASTQSNTKTTGSGDLSLSLSLFL